MAHKTTHECPECKELVEVFVDQDDVPSMSDQYAYDCPKCGNLVVTTLGAFVLESPIPEGGTVARLMN